MSSYTPLLAVLLALLAGLAIGKAWERYKLREGKWFDRRRECQLLSADGFHGRRAAEQLARCSFAVDPGHCAEDTDRPEAGPRRTLDAPAGDRITRRCGNSA